MKWLSVLFKIYILIICKLKKKYIEFKWIDVSARSLQLFDKLKIWRYVKFLEPCFFCIPGRWKFCSWLMTYFPDGGSSVLVKLVFTASGSVLELKFIENLYNTEQFLRLLAQAAETKRIIPSRKYHKWTLNY